MQFIALIICPRGGRDIERCAFVICLAMQGVICSSEMNVICSLCEREEEGNGDRKKNSNKKGENPQV